MMPASSPLWCICSLLVTLPSQALSICKYENTKEHMRCNGDQVIKRTILQLGLLPSPLLAPPCQGTMMPPARHVLPVATTVAALAVRHVQRWQGFARHLGRALLSGSRRNNLSRPLSHTGSATLSSG